MIFRKKLYSKHKTNEHQQNKDPQISTNEIYIGYLVQIMSKKTISGNCDSFREWLLTSTIEYDCQPIKKVLVQRKSTNTYEDLISSSIYSTEGHQVGDVFIDNRPGRLIPINPYLPENERSTNMPKSKVLAKFTK